MNVNQASICSYLSILDPWADLGDEDDGFGSKSDGHLREYQSFTDLMYSKDKRLTAVEWYPHIKSIIAVSCAQRYSLYERIEKAPKLLLSRKLILIWSFQDPIHPCILLEAPADVYCFKVTRNFLNEQKKI